MDATFIHVFSKKLLRKLFFQADECPPGYFCPEGTGYRFSHPCPVGFYRKLSAAVSVQDCSVCFSGHFCNVTGLAEPIVCPKVRDYLGLWHFGVIVDSQSETFDSIYRTLKCDHSLESC